MTLFSSSNQNNQYISLEEAERDLMLMVKNAHAFNEPGSQVYKVCIKLKLFLKFV